MSEILKPAIMEGIDYACTLLMGMENTEEVRIATKVLILKYVSEKLPLTIQEIQEMVELDVLPAKDDKLKFQVRVRVKEEKKHAGRPRKITA